MRHDASERTVYVLAGEYSADPDDAHPVAVFEKARGASHPGRALETLMARAGERALRTLALGDDGRLRVDQLLLTTMPDVGGSAMAHAIHLPNVLKRRLQLAEACQARFEVGSSDAGASLFASAVHLLKGLDEPGTALVVAGQVMPGGRGAIQTVSQVLDEPERALGVTMIAVGDLLLDLEAWQWRQERGRRSFLPGLSVGERVADAEPPPAAEFALELLRMVSHKLRLAEEYPAAQRGSDEGPEGAARISRWMTDWHLARASNGACAVVLTTDERLVRRWLAATGQRRVVRVLGVGEGDADPRLSMRAEPFAFFKSLRQALVSLRRNTDTNHDFLRSAAFSVLHDAFPSIEHAFLLGLGFSPVEAMRRSRTYWPNPYGGLTAFGHALAASGLVQIAKAFHVFTRAEAYVTRLPGPLNLDCSGTAESLHCVTTSVGGPLSHIVATLLQSCPVPAGAETTTNEPLLEPFRPRKRHRLNEPLVKDFEAKTRWVARLAERYREALAAPGAPPCPTDCDLAIVEARTHFDLRLMHLPLPRAFLSDHTTPDAAVAAALAADTVEDARLAVRAHLAARLDLPSSEGEAAAEREAGERRVWANLRVPVAVVTGPQPAASEPGTVRAFALITDTAAACEVGDLVVVTRADASGYPIVSRRLEAEHTPGLVPPWYRGLGAAGAMGHDGPPLLLPDTPLRYIDTDDRLQETTPLDVLHRLVHSGLDPEIMCVLQALATTVVERLLVAPTRVPPNGAVRLLHELVLQPEPSRFRLATALRELTGLGDADPAPPPELLAFCEFALLPGLTPEGPGVAPRLNAVSEAMRRADGWLAGAQVTHGRIGDAYAVTVRHPAGEGSAWRAALRFACEVHRTCLAVGVPVRAAVCVGEGMTFSEAFGRFGAMGEAQVAVHEALATATVPADGLALVVTGEVDEASARERCDALWASLAEPEIRPHAFGPLPAACPGSYFDSRHV